VKATKVNAGLAESNGRLLLDIWRDSLHVTCGLTACTPGSALGQTLGNEYGKLYLFNKQKKTNTHLMAFVPGRPVQTGTRENTEWLYISGTGLHRLSRKKTIKRVFYVLSTFTN